MTLNTLNETMTSLVGSNLVSILRGDRQPLELMLKDELLYRYYEEDLRLTSIHRQVGQIMEILGHEKPGLRILEVGGGTGSCTNAILSALRDCEPGSLLSYDFTDISNAFFEGVQRRFEQWGDLVSCHKLDIEQDVASQGFADVQYDVIVASRVLYATHNVANALANIHKLLKPGGWLLLVEVTKEVPDDFLVSGVLPGWWSTGFGGLDLLLHDREDTTLRSTSLFLSRRAHVEELPPLSTQSIRLWHRTEQDVPPAAWVNQIRTALTPHDVAISCLDSLDGTLDPTTLEPNEVCIVLDHQSSEHSLLADMNEKTYDVVRTLLTTSKRTLWVTRGGALSSPNYEAALHLGLLRTLRCEHAEAKYASLDLDANRNAWSLRATSTIASIIIRTLFDPRLGPMDIESECAESDGVIMVPRVFPTLSARHGSKVPLQPFHQKDQEIRLAIASPGLLDSVYFTTWNSARKPLADDEVDIEPAAFGLNVRDIMVALGQLDSDLMGFQCSGIVKAAGSATGLQPGQRVSAILRGHWSNTIRVHCSSVVKIPDTMSMQVAASIPMVYLTAYLSLVETARCRQGQSILIHSATGGVGQAAIQVAQWLKMEVFATAGSLEKREYLQKTFGIPASHIFSSRDESFAVGLMEATDQRGVDIVLNSLSGPLLRKTWECIARFGHFVEIGKRDIESNGHLSMEAFGRNVSFSSIDLVQIGYYDHPLMARSFPKVMSLLTTGVLRPIGPIYEYDLSEIKSAMRLMQTGRHMGKIIVNATETTQVDIVNNAAAPTLSPDATYLIVCGLGGLGMAILEHFFAMGAKNLLALSRSASRHAESSAAVKHLRKQGCNVRAIDCDVADLKSLHAVLDCAKSTMAPIRGVVQAAMVLRDSIFETMSYSDFLQALRPKLSGTYNLHSSFSERSALDFFIVLSSISGVGGNASQANYATGGTYQDALVRHRASMGLPGVCIDLGVVKSVGVVSQNSKLAENLARLKYRRLEEHEVLGLIDEAIASPIRTWQTAQVITGIVSASEAEVQIPGISWRREPRFRGMINPAISSSGSSSSPTKATGSGLSTLQNELKACSTLDEGEKIIAKGIQQKISDMFMIPVDEIYITEPLSNYGVDSLVAVELRNWLVSQACSAVAIFDVMRSAHTLELARRTAFSSKILSSGGGEHK